MYLRYSVSRLLLSLCLFLLFILVMDTLYAQEKGINIKRTHSINPVVPNRTTDLNIGKGTLHIVAVMVEFQPDTNAFTSGTGVFGPGSIPYLDTTSVRIDPLPHNRSYFQAHLEFVKNYYNRVSGGQLDINYQLLPDIIRLDEEMAAFSPTGESFTFEKIANMVRQSWAKVEQNGGFNTIGLDPEETAFVIFHAGVGRDIELTGQTLDRTPQDIPSVYMSKRALQVSLDQPNFNGFSINNGNFRVTNSLVIPRTLSRRGQDILGNPFVIQLSTNGLLAANIGSHLGLPDLFNTEDGSSGIGRFGLMDGEGFLGFAGLFPPEPSAWEKIRMGWQQPFSLDLTNNQPIELPAAVFHAEQSIAIHRITEDEFFLIENRHRNPENQGVDISVRNNDGDVSTVTFQNADTAFSPVNAELPQLLPKGVLVDVSNFDWALPGGLDAGNDEIPFTEDDRNLNGGILIWHIDEAVIEDKISSLSVNNNPFRRGVDVEEADGAQDIGRALPNVFGDTELGRGTAFDFWWKNNNSFAISATGDTLRLFENRFGPDTRPSNATNSGGPTFFELFDFSENLPVASFRARGVSPENIIKVSLPVSKINNFNSFVAEEDSFSTFYPPTITAYTSASDTLLLLPGRNKTVSVSTADINNPTFNFPVQNSQQPLLIEPSTSSSKLILSTRPISGTPEINITGWEYQSNTWKKSWETSADPNRGFISSNSSDIFLVDFTKQQLRTTDGSFFNPLEEPQISANDDAGFSAILANNSLNSTILGNNGQISTQKFQNSFRRYPIPVELTPNEPAVALLTDNSLAIAENNAPDIRTIFESSDRIGWPAIADIDRNNQVDFLFVDHATGLLHGKNRNGSNLNFFPVEPPEGTQFTGTPLLIDLESDGETDLLIPGQDSLSLNIYGYSNKGEPKSNFPLFAGSISDQQNQPLNPVLINQTLFAISHEGDLSAWKFNNATEAIQASKYGDPTKNKPFSQLTNEVDRNSFTGIINKKETYNWPNPANQETFLRFQLQSAGEVSVQIISYSGSLMLEKEMTVSNTAPFEFRINTASWGSGAYFARIEANVDGTIERKVVKIAVVH